MLKEEWDEKLPRIESPWPQTPHINDVRVEDPVKLEERQAATRPEHRIFGRHAWQNEEDPGGFPKNVNRTRERGSS